MNWDDLEFWKSREWSETEEKLDALDRRGVLLCPRRELLFRALDLVSLDRVRVVIIAQDPYPNIVDATGIAFSIPPDLKVFPYSLGVILKEYSHDLHYPIPLSGDLTRWCQQGVLLWNSVLSTEHGKSMAHYTWSGWRSLTKELVRVLDRQGVVFCLLGRVAHEYSSLITSGNSQVIKLAHPASERYNGGSTNKRNLFSGSRPFSLINDRLHSLSKPTINWRLDDGQPQAKAQASQV